MNLPIHVNVTQYPRRVRWVMAAAWVLILAKCLLISWAVERYHMPFNAAWVIAPTLVFAGLATVLWLTHREE
jgi:hypothetical protein